MNVIIDNEEAMLKFAGKVAQNFISGNFYLSGNLGAGKTTFVRGFLNGLGFHGKVKSPSYTLIESYEIDTKKIFHFDLYRLHDPAELEYLGIDDYFIEDAICLVEWPEKASDLLPVPDINCYIEIMGGSRKIKLEARDKKSQEVLDKIK